MTAGRRNDEDRMTNEEPLMKKKPTKGKFWVLDTQIEGTSAGTLTACGPFESQASAEAYILNAAGQDWISSCGCLRSGDPEKWADEHVILQEIRRVKPVPPERVQMKLVEVDG